MGVAARLVGCLRWPTLGVSASVSTSAAASSEVSASALALASARRGGRRGLQRSLLRVRVEPVMERAWWSQVTQLGTELSIQIADVAVVEHIRPARECLRYRETALRGANPADASWCAGTPQGRSSPSRGRFPRACVAQTSSHLSAGLRLEVIGMVWLRPFCVPVGWLSMSRGCWPACAARGCALQQRGADAQPSEGAASLQLVDEVSQRRGDHLGLGCRRHARLGGLLGVEPLVERVGAASDVTREPACGSAASLRR